MKKMSKAEMDKVVAPAANAVPSAPPSIIRVTKEQAKEATIGEKISITLSGTVKSIRQCYDDKENYEIELSDSESTDISGNKADKEYANFMGGKKK